MDYSGEMKSHTILFALGLGFFMAWAPQDAAAVGKKLVEGGAGVAGLVVDGDTLTLEDGRRIRLVGIQAPKLPLGRAHVKRQPLADRAKSVLEDIALGKQVRLSYGGQRVDRHGRLLAHLHTPSGEWIQGRLLELGLARVYSFRDNRTWVGRMLALEDKARRARRGIWGLDYYRVRTPDETFRLVDTFQLVQGRVVSAAKVRGRIYLNFGEDWRRDYTVTVSKRDLRAFAEKGLDPLSWRGRVIRVRGWLHWRNGPMIDASHPEQIEVMGE